MGKRWSKTVDGDQGNHQFQYRFDDTDGYIGITRMDESFHGPRYSGRVLLSPAQYAALVAFVGKSRRQLRPTVRA